MKKEDIELLEEYGWTLIDDNPLQVAKYEKATYSHVGTIIGNDAVELILEALRHRKFAY